VPTLEPRPGRVFLVGAGPGDPDLITLKGRRALLSADLILFDHLAGAELPATAEHIYVGKKRADHSMPQSAIIALMIARARAGQTVVRLKGGDPFLFGRGGEEAEALAAAGVRFEVIPGVTAPLGIAAYTGVPLTHRDLTSTVTFVTGHEPARIDWSAVAAAGTIVVYMGLTTLADVAQRKMAAGRDASTPAMAVRWATRPDQQVIAAPLGELAARVAEAGMKPPATIVIGAVVSLREQLHWLTRERPLAGQRVVITRAADQADSLTALLREAGAEPVLLPMISIGEPDDTTALDEALLRLSRYDWLIFTSVNGVKWFTRRVTALGVDIRRWPARVAAIGPETARYASFNGLVRLDLVPERFDAEGLAEAFENFEMQGRRVLLARGAEGRDVVPETLRARGAQVDVVEVYRNRIPEDAPAQAAQVFAAHKPHWIAFTSSSTVKNLLTVIDRAQLDGVRLASIGPATSETMRKHGLTVDAEADPHTAEGLAAAMVSVGSRRKAD